MSKHEYLRTLLLAIPYERGVEVEASIDLKNDLITLSISAPQKGMNTSILGLPSVTLADKIGLGSGVGLAQSNLAAGAALP